jgi:hypothetical protein
VFLSRSVVSLARFARELTPESKLECLGATPESECAESLPGFERAFTVRASEKHRIFGAFVEMEETRQADLASARQTPGNRPDHQPSYRLPCIYRKMKPVPKFSSDYRMVNAMRTLAIIFLMFAAGAAWSFTVSGTTYTTNGSQSDVQRACNAVPDNGTVTVVIPNGTYSWTGTLTIRKSLTLAGASSTGVKINNNLASGAMISATAGAAGHINIYWLNVVQMANNGGGKGFALTCDRTERGRYTVVVHDCTFSSGSIYTYMVLCRDNGIIFWNDTFVGDGPNDPLAAGGISFVCQKYGYTSSWNTPDTYGVQDTTGLANCYVEDSKFYDGATGICNFDDNSRVVWRYNTIQECMLGTHGQETSIYGVRSWEIYNNTFIHPTSGTGPSGNTYPMNMNGWFGGRGGSGVICNNAMDDIPSKTGISLTVFSINRLDSIPCQTAYPAARQTGQGWSASSKATYGNPVVREDGTGAITEGVYIWGNTGSETTDPNYVGLDQYSPDDCGNGELVTNFLKKGRDYFVGTAKPNYSPYQYPHPLHTAFARTGASPTPAPTPTPNVRHPHRRT